MATLSPPPETSDVHSSHDLYYFAVCIAVVAVIIIICNVIAFACCRPRQLIRDLRAFLRAHRFISHDQTLNSLPVCKYREDQNHDQEMEETSGVECPVCLSTFIDGEELRQLPQCKHSFHLACIDMWLNSHSNCPVCRAKVLPPLPPTCSTASQQATVDVIVD
ncbi:hypothetical protein J5N97_006114 [Dioscorea zingiberensis]|uniref:RING-type domain-containing protein n=1 Tax=Dioscorea zingiberensis TaxID=325984 RepID=A0A9D5DBD0_9LILI|nr:hypothetical protein J5N97_006114 [Dioscorea zingiberensis]